jgi:DNA helicase-2/ATP-dependent DNA helicase PcrA
MTSFGSVGSSMDRRLASQVPGRGASDAGGSVAGVVTDILAGLNGAQRRAAEAVTGPVAILAGAGTGKTTAITHRIANQVATGAFPADRLLAVTFTTKAAGELRERLERLGVEGVDARTFHSAALAELRWLWTAHTGEPVPEVLGHKAGVIGTFARSLPMPYRFTPRRELATEIEWAKNRRIEPGGYAAALGDHVPPVPVDLMLRVYEGYERTKRAMDRIDFEDLLTLAVRLLREHPDAAATFRERFHAFTVDEFQDVNPLQADLLGAWLGDRHEVCVVGDDYQTIYGFTGASPAYLTGFAERHPGARVITLTENYRSSPQVLDLANALARHLGGEPRSLSATRDGGPPPGAQQLSTERAETDAVVDAVRRLRDDAGVPLEEIAVLYRINARSEPFEEAFAAAGIPYQVKDGAFLSRPGPRAALAALRRRPSAPVSDAVESAIAELGGTEGDADDDEDVTRRADLARLRVLAGEFAAAHEGGTAGAFADELATRFTTERDGRGVQLLTYHRAKGLEFDAVFLPRLIDGELPFRSGRSTADPLEERRLLYVGLTRARRYLFLTWSREGKSRPSPYLAEMGLKAPAHAKAVARAPVAPAGDGPIYERLKRWRAERAKADGVPAYVVFHDRTLGAIAEEMPGDRAALSEISGVGPTKLDRYADEVLAVVASAGERGPPD